MVAEPQPAQLPFPGGQEGASVRLRPLLTGEMLGPPAFFHRVEGRLARLRALGFGVALDDYLRIPIPAFLIEHPGAGPILIDTGLHPSVAVDPRQNLGWAAPRLFKGIEMTAAQAVPAQLRALGIEPAAVGLIVMTHLHVDHASAISEFPDATFVFSEREWEAAREGRQRDGYVKRQFDFGFDYRLLDFDSAETESFASFGRSFDLLGDGSIRAVYTPGHSHGHMSVVLRLRGRELLICGDAINTLRTLRDGVPPAQPADEHLFRRSLKEIQRYAEQTPGALIVPGHDWDSFSALDPVYE